jgi:cytochrome c peroxidase
MSVGGLSIQQFPLQKYTLDYLGLETNPLRIKKSPYPFEDLGEFRGKNGAKKFRVPILRNITLTSPYFHNGAVKEIEEVVRIMSKYQLGDEFSKSQIADVVEFLKTLEGDIVDYGL